MRTYRLFIGANNETGNVETSLIESKLNQHFEGYTIENATGYWLGKKESSVIVTISGNEQTILNVIRELKEVLKQDAIAYQLAPALNFI
jgi:N6-adenosine-specific RNA methylase IME4